MAGLSAWLAQSAVAPVTSGRKRPDDLEIDEAQAHTQRRSAAVNRSSARGDCIPPWRCAVCSGTRTAPWVSCQGGPGVCMRVGMRHATTQMPSPAATTSTACTSGFPWKVHTDRPTISTIDVSATVLMRRVMLRC